MPRSLYDEKRTTTRYDIGSTAIYVGYADYLGDGSAPSDSDPAWTIKRITLSGGSPTKTEWTNPGGGTWDNRASESYV